MKNLTVKDVVQTTRLENAKPTTNYAQSVTRPVILQKCVVPKFN